MSVKILTDSSSDYEAYEKKEKNIYLQMIY